jgi:GNAT superfamily N-acetyltransferase
MYALFEIGSLYLYEFNLSNEIPNITHRDDITIRLHTQSSYKFDASEDYQLQPPQIFHGRNYEHRYERGDLAFLAIENGATVGYCWITSLGAVVAELQRELILRGNDVYIYDAYTIPSRRGRNIFPTILTHISRYSRRNGYERCLIFARKSNLSSRNGIKKAGYNHFYSIAYLRLFGITACWGIGGANKFGIEFR